MTHNHKLFSFASKKTPNIYIKTFGRKNCIEFQWCQSASSFRNESGLRCECERLVGVIITHTKTSGRGVGARAAPDNSRRPEVQSGRTVARKSWFRNVIMFCLFFWENVGSLLSEDRFGMIMSILDSEVGFCVLGLKIIFFTILLGVLKP